ncbi:MAG: MFS transporter [Myxococcaceae bacterium]
MIQRFLEFFRSGPDKPALNLGEAAIARIYERKRWSVFLSVIFGYGMFYVCRINFSVVKKPILDAGVLTATQMGLAGSAMLTVYAIGKLFNGLLADRANIRRFMSMALLASAGLNLILGSTTLFVFFAVLWGLNGWMQSIGSAPSVVALSQWFSAKERGTRYGIWSVSHSLGEATTFVFTAILVSAFGWRWGFWGPGLLGVAMALVLTRTLSDRPQTYGLPAVSSYRNDPTPIAAKAVGQSQLAVLKSPAIWVLGLSSAAMYVARYGINNWGVLFLQTTKGYSLVDAGSILAASPILALAGSALSGIISDRFFGSRRNLPALIFGIAEFCGLLGFFFVPPGHPVLDIVSIGVFGFALGGLLVYLGGLMAVDLAPQNATGAAMGVIGLFSYIGAAIQDTVSGYLLDANKVMVGGEAVYSFDQVFIVWLGASFFAVVLPLLVWNAKRPGVPVEAPASALSAGTSQETL